MRNFVALVFAVLSCSGHAQIAQRVIDIPTRPGVAQRLLILPTPDPKATAILFAGAERLTTLYGLSFSEPNVVILVRHRAVLFGLLGLLLICAAFRRSMQPAAFVGGFVSVISFLCLAWSVGGYNAQIERVFVADAIALMCLVVAAAAYLYSGRAR